MKTIIFLFTTLLFFSCNSPGNNSTQSEPTYQVAKMTIEEKEKSNPHDFIKVNGTYHFNLINQFVISGNITNNATVANYKDVIIRVQFLSETNTPLEQKDITIYKYLNHASSLEFKEKFSDYPRDTKSCSLEIVNASVQ